MSNNPQSGSVHMSTSPSQRSSLRLDNRGGNLDSASLGVLSGTVGSSFGPFPRASLYSTNGSVSSRYDLYPSSDVAIDLKNNGNAGYATESEAGYGSGASRPDLAPIDSAVDAHLLWNKENTEDDDYLHDPDPELDRMLDKQWSNVSLIGWINTAALLVVIIVLVGLFAGWPIYRYAIHGGFPSDGTSTDQGWNLGGINGTGQIPDIPNLPSLIDSDTPESAYTRTGFDGETYNLVFSDEFNVDGRTFWPGDDPWWEAVDLHYWATTDLEWYDPDAITTKNGAMEITVTEQENHNLNFRSGMVQTWNKFCFTGGYVVVNVSFPGDAFTQGYWPAAWTMGNLGRAGFGASNDGTWPYSYNTCDVGTLPNQTWPNGTSPAAAKTSGDKDYGGELSYLPGQRLSACTCPGEDHPGPSHSVGRGAPEIDILEAQIAPTGDKGSISQSIQLGPMDAGYNWKNTTPYIEMYNETITYQNVWHGAVTQESLSVNTLGDKTSYDGAGWTSYGFEYVPGDSGHIIWAQNETATWRLNSDAIGPDDEAEISQRPIAEEPMYLILNLAISNKFQEIQWGKITFPQTYRIDYVRVYQKGDTNIGCNPKKFPTEDYINRHLDVYTNANLTTWSGANKTWPANSLSAEGCS